MSLIDDHLNAVASSGRAIHPPTTTPPCRTCGRTPTADVTFASLVATRRSWVTSRRPGPYCRDCGLASFRTLTAKTLVGGWWGAAAIVVATYVVIVNCLRRRTVVRLAAPTVDMAGRRPSPPGKPLFRRWQILGALVPVVVFGGVVFIVWTLVSAIHSSNATNVPPW